MIKANSEKYKQTLVFVTFLETDMFVYSFCEIFEGNREDTKDVRYKVKLHELSFRTSSLIIIGLLDKHN